MIHLYEVPTGIASVIVQKNVSKRFERYPRGFTEEAPFVTRKDHKPNLAAPELFTFHS